MKFGFHRFISFSQLLRVLSVVQLFNAPVFRLNCLRNFSVSSLSTSNLSGSITTPYSLRPRSIEINPSSTSHRTLSGSLSRGFPHPPPPEVTVRKLSPSFTLSSYFRRNLSFPAVLNKQTLCIGCLFSTKNAPRMDLIPVRAHGNG